MKGEAICVHQNPPMRKKKALNFENGMSGGELKLFKIKDSSHIENCALKCRGKNLLFYF